MEAFLSIPWATISPWGIIAFICGCIVRGDLVPAKLMNSRLEDRDVLIGELKERNLAQGQRTDVLLSQNTELLIGARTTRHVVESLPTVHGGGQNDLASQES